MTKYLSTCKPAEQNERAILCDSIFRMHSDVNRAVSIAVYAIMAGSPVQPAAHLLQTAIDLSLREMRKKLEGE